MNNIIRLLHLQIDNKSDILKTASPKSMILPLVKTVILMLLGMLGVSFALSRIFVLGFAITEELLSLVLLCIQVVTFVFAVGSLVNTLYLSRDNELLICLPVTPNQLFISKMLMIYIHEFTVNLTVFIPVFLAIGSFSKFGLSFYLSFIPLVLLLPFLPIVFAAFLSIPIMAIVKFLKRHTVISIVTVFTLVAACLWVYVGFIGSIASNFDIAEKQVETVRQINAQIAEIGSKIPLYYRIACGMGSFSLWYIFPIFALVCAVIFALTVLFTRYFFFKTAMSNMENTVKVKKKVTPYKERSQFVALFLKEMHCVFRSFSEVFEYFLFTILMPFIVFSYDKLLMSITVNQAGQNMIAGAHVMVVAILAMLSNISSASAVSRDGGNFYMSKIVPVDYYTHIFAKFAFNAVFTFGALIVTAVISCFIYPVWQVVLGTFAVAFAAIGHIAYSIDTDIKNPTVAAVGDEKSATVSKSTPKSLIYGLVIGFVMGITMILMSSLENALIPYLVIIGASLLFMIYRINTLILRINLKYDKIEM